MKAGMMTEDFNRMIKATKSFVQKTGSRKIYQYIRMEFCAESSRVTAVAVDGYRMSVEHAMCYDCDEDFVIYVRDNITLPKKNNVMFERVDGECMIKCNDMIFGYVQPDGEFLDWEKALPEKAPEYKIAFNGDFMISALQSARTSVGNVFKNPVVLEFRGPNEPIILRTNKDDIKMVLPVRIKQ